MKYDFQRADIMKRAPAWLLDVILLLVLTTGAAYLWSLVFDVQTPYEEYVTIGQNYEQGFIEEYESTYGELPTYTQIEWEQMTQEEQEAAQKAWEELPEQDKLIAQNAMNEIGRKVSDALNQDEAAINAWSKLISNGLSIVSLSVLVAYTILEFAVPLLLKNGQTIGKKCFGVALMRKDGLKVTPFMMFARTILGKYTVETMIPILLLGSGVAFMGFPVTIAGLVIALVPAVVCMATRNKTAIHDLMACTVAVDLSSQMIFNTVEEMEAYHEDISVNTTSWDNQETRPE